MNNYSYIKQRRILMEEELCVCDIANIVQIVMKGCEHIEEL